MAKVWKLIECTSYLFIYLFIKVLFIFLFIYFFFLFDANFILGSSFLINRVPPFFGQNRPVNPVKWILGNFFLTVCIHIYIYIYKLKQSSSMNNTNKQLQINSHFIFVMSKLTISLPVEFQWVPHSYGIVPHLSKKFSKLQLFFPSIMMMIILKKSLGLIPIDQIWSLRLWYFVQWGISPWNTENPFCYFYSIPFFERSKYFSFAFDIVGNILNCDFV